MTEADLWKLYVLLARIERSFRYLKSNLGIRSVFHQRTERADAHIFISLLAYHLLHAIERRLPVLATAIAGDADLIVCGDRDHMLAAGSADGIPIITTREADDQACRTFRRDLSTVILSTLP